MYPFNRFVLLAPVLFVFVGLSVPAKAAMVKYSYIANPFTQYTVANLGISEEIPPDPSQVLSMWFIVNDAQVPRNGRVELQNFYSAVVENSIFQIHDYAVSVGPQIRWRPGGSRLGAFLNFDTDAEGNVRGNWRAGAFDFLSRGVSENMETAEGLVVRDYVEDLGFFEQDGSFQGHLYQKSITNNPGTWTRELVTVPLPGGLLLFASALGGYFFNRRLSGQQIAPK